jgi:hypothetical protein
MALARNYQQELVCTESFPAALGTCILLPSKTVLWKNGSSDQTCELHHFSAQSDKCCTRFCSDRMLRLMDYRHASLIVSDFQQTLGCDVNTIATVCRYMKKCAQYGPFGELWYRIDGVVICAKNGIHVVLFDMKDVHECEYEPIVIPEGFVSLFQSIPTGFVKIINSQLPHVYVLDGVSNSPTPIVIPECSLSESVVDIERISKWPSMHFKLLGLRHPNHHLDREMPYYQSIKWDEHFLPVYGTFIDLPKDVILWRGYDTQYPTLSERPAYFGDRSVAEHYAQTSDTHRLGLFATTRSLKLIDIRFLKVLLNDLFYERDGNIVKKTTVAFGLCSFKHQLRLMKTMYADSDPGFKAMLKVYAESDIEQPGVRVPETSNDGWVMAVLGELFDGVADGFVSPKLFTPYQVHTRNTLHPELIVFNPIKSGIIQLNAIPKNTPVSVADLIYDQKSGPILIHAYDMKTSYVGCGRTRKRRNHNRNPHTTRSRHNRDRNNGYIPAIEAFNDLLNRGDPDAIQQYNEAIEEGKKLRKKVAFSHYIIEDNTKL